MTNKLSVGDLNRVIRNIPNDVRTMLKVNAGMCVGGGLIRSVVCGEKPQDIDVFGVSVEQLQGASAALALQRKHGLSETGVPNETVRKEWVEQALALSGNMRYHVSKNAITLVCMGRAPVQFITRWVYTSPDKIVQSFDFTVCKSVVWFDQARDTWDSEVDEDFYTDLAARRLVYTSPIRNEDAGGSLMRVRKFLGRGYNIQAKALAGTIARLMLSIDMTRVGGICGAEGVSMEIALARVITGKLREVDPLLVVDGVDPEEPEVEL